MTPAYMTILQFMVTGVTVLVRGKNAKTNTGHKYARAAMLIAIPHLPSDQRCSGSGSPRMRFRRRQLIEMM